MIENFSYYIKVIYLININVTCLYLYITIFGIIKKYLLRLCHLILKVAINHQKFI